jgi:DNA repair protein RecO (recombination protein O)
LKAYPAEGIALLARKYRGTGRVVTFFTREHGKVEAAAQGVGKPNSSLAAAVELFAHSQLYFVRGHNLDRLTQARVIEAFERLRRDPLRLGYAGFVCELIAGTTEPDQALPPVFDDLLAALRLLDAGHEPMAVAAAASWRILGALGVAPEMDACVRCAGAWQQRAVFLPGEGGVVCSKCLTAQDTVASAGHHISLRLRALAATLRRLSLDRLPRLRVEPSLWADLLHLTRLQVRYYLGLELQSDAFLRQVESR